MGENKCLLTEWWAFAIQNIEPHTEMPDVRIAYTQGSAPEIAKIALKKFITHHGIPMEKSFTIALI